MEDNSIEIESFSSNDIVSSLWNKNASEKCRIGLADTLVYEDGVPVRWYVTGKTGEVTKKRGVDLDLVSQRWLKIREQYDSPIVAIVRQEGGVLKFLNIEAWYIFISQKADSSVLSVHCFINGENHQVYRNKFAVKDKLGRFVCSTHVYTFNLSKDVPDSVVTMYENKLKLVESRANQIKNIMDLATSTVVRYAETMLQVKILDMTVDYVIDKKSQVWMLWAPDAKFIRATSLKDIELPNILDKRGRSGWMGDKYFEELQEKEEYDRQQSPTGRRTGGSRSQSPSFSPTSRATGSRFSPERSCLTLQSTAIGGAATPAVHSLAGTTGVGSVYQPFPAEEDRSIPIHVAAVQVNEAVNANVTKKTQRKRVNENESNTTFNVVHQPSQASEVTGHFPHPFKCKGDYCNFIVTPAGNLAASAERASEHVAQKLFTAKEIEQLRKDRNFAQMMEFESVGPALAVLTMRSILLARQERRGIEGGNTSQPWNVYPNSPRAKIKFRPDASAISHLEGGAEKPQELKAAEEVMERDKEQRDAFTKSMSHYYDQTRVCGVCYGIYTCLDWARDLLGRGDAYGAGLEGLGAAHPKPSKTGKTGRGPRPRLADGSDAAAGSLLESSAEFEEGKGKLPSLTMPSYASATTASAVSAALAKPHRSASMTSNAPGSPNSKTRPKISREHDMQGGTWKSHVAAQREHDNVKGAKFVALDDYLRGGSEALNDRKMRERERQAKLRATGSLLDSVESLPQLSSHLHNSSTGSFGNVYRGKVLLACEDNIHAEEARNILEDASFEVHHVQDGRKAINDFILLKEGYDCVLVQSDLPLQDAFAVAHQVRREEATRRKEAAAFATSQSKGIQPPTRRHPVICYTSETSPEDLRAYMKADMDGCVSFPVNKLSLLNTVRAAVPQHLAKLTSNELREAEEAALRLANSKIQTKVFRQGALGELEGSTDSASMAIKTLPISQSEDDIAFNGIVQIDADTRVPFMVLDSSRTAKVSLNADKPYFNLVVVHDLFDTSEKMKIFLRPMIQRYLGMQVLLWNYPGQAFTEWREEQLLNNEYHATCLNEVLGQVGEKGTRDFDTSRPFYIMGFGNGANIASFYASHYRVPNLRGLISVNGWSFVDSYLAGIMHDCINIFQCAPPSRPDLPVYFFSRFLFCKDYLARVSVPLALNIYTAVHNSISIKGRLNLCKGVLQSVDVRALLKEIDCPLICIHSTQDALARPLHTEPFIAKRAGEVRSINKVLQNPRKTCVVWMKGGHEVFQENKKQLQQVLEQILTGFHENHDVAFPTAAQVDATSAAQGKLVSSLPWENKKQGDKTVEDKFIDNVLGSINRLNSASSPSRASNHVGATAAAGSRPGTSSMAAPSSSLTNAANLVFSQSTSALPRPPAGQSVSPSRNRPGTSHAATTLNGQSLVFNSTDPDAWQQYSQVLSENLVHTGSGADAGKKKISGRNKKGVDESGRIIDPTSSLFERQDSVVYGARTLEMKKMQDVHDFPEVKEYMGWRLKRNKKRLQRLQAAARTIQGAFRAFVARRLVHGIRRLKACLLIQRVFRGWLGRCEFKNRARGIWASQIIQRAFRGYMARKWYFFMRLKIAACANIQRMFRGFRARQRVNYLKLCRYRAAAIIQAMFRRYDARRLVWRMRQFRNCSTAIQRIYRGHLGRAKATAERDKYIFSRSQSQGIEFGRQMLLEHKLHATRLQSDVTLLTQEKVAAEEQIEALLEEISTFEEGVRTLEKEMHQLSKVESEASAFMDEDSKFELREQKMKLDREFGEMLGRISNRKDMLDDLERKLSTIDKSRQAKEEQLRTLERKLVVLLEEQQNELAAIKRKQDVRGAMLAASHDELMRATGGGSTAGGARPNTASTGGISGGGGGGGGGGFSGPSLQEKKQAAQLMQSTETLMKFGFMSMSMTYFSSMNMVKALRTVSAQDTVMAALADVHAQRAVGYAGPGGGGDEASMKKAPFLPDLKAGQLPGQQLLRVSAWSVEDVAKWLQTLSLGQYSEAFIDSAVDGEFLYDLNDDDLKNTLGIEHRLHRKKILNCVHRLKLAEAQKDNKLNELLRESGSFEAPVSVTAMIKYMGIL